MFPGNFAEAVAQFDTNDDGLIDFNEFIELDRRYPLVLFPAFRLQDRMQRVTLGQYAWVDIHKSIQKTKHIQEYMDAHGNVDLTQPRHMPAVEKGGGGHTRKPHRDPLATKVLSTARKALMNANLIFYSGPVGGSGNGSSSSSGKDSANVCGGGSDAIKR